MKLETLTNRRILFRALDWGMGHVTRSISILNQLQEQGNSLFIVGSKKQNEIFQLYGIEAQFYEVDETSWCFNGSGSKINEGLKVVRTVQKLKQDSKVLVEKLVPEFQIDLIVSDHVYGFQSNKVHSIFITHQVQLPPKTNFAAKYVHKRWLNSFDFIWIVDDVNKRLARDLSTQLKDKSSYIGLRSRFQLLKPEPIDGIDFLVVVSGPKPYSTLFLNSILALAKETKTHLYIFCPLELRISHPYAYYSQSNSEADNWFASADLIISRTGYSTLMDCEVLSKKAILIATKNQAEQEYLAEINSNKQIESYSSSKELLFFNRLKELFTPQSREK